MRIGLVGPHEPDTFADNIGHTLANMGHSVIQLGSLSPNLKSRVATGFTGVVEQAYPRVQDRSHLKVASLALANECELVISTDASLVPKAVSFLRNNRVSVALWFPDAVVNLGRLRMLAAPYSGLFFKDELLVQRIRDTLGLPIWYLPQACNPTWHRPIGDPGKDRYIVVVGNTYLSRLLLLERLHNDGIPLQIYGSPIPRWAPTVIPASCHTGKSVRREVKSRVFREAAAVLNNMHPAEMDSVNLRLFEATAAGAAVLCERRPSLNSLYDPGSELLPFSTYDELLTHTRNLLENRELTQLIGDAASARAYKEHTYEDRLTTMLEKLA